MDEGERGRKRGRRREKEEERGGEGGERIIVDSSAAGVDRGRQPLSGVPLEPCRRHGRGTPQTAKCRERPAAVRHELTPS